MTVNPASSNFTPQVKQARNLSKIFNRKSITHNTTHGQFQMSWMWNGYKIKKMKTPRKMQKNNLLRTKRILNIKISPNGGRVVFTFILPGGRLVSPPQSRPSVTPLLVLEDTIVSRRWASNNQESVNHFLLF